MKTKLPAVNAGGMIELTAGDGHTLDAYMASPDGQPKGGLVMIQEIFGLTEQMKRCADTYAEAGYLTVLPALFDRTDNNVVLGYTEFQKGGQLSMSLDEQCLLADVEAARLSVAGAGKTAIIGYCFGGTVAYRGACMLDFACAVCYYGGSIGQLVDRMQPKIPVMYHFGAEDTYISNEVIGHIRDVDRTGIFHIYEGTGHGFNCDDRDGYHAEAAKLSTQRTRTFFAEHLD